MPITTCDSPEILKAEIDSIRKKVTLDESEETWDTIAQGVLHLTRLCNIGGCQCPSEMITAIRSLSRPLNNALNSERSRLSGAAVELVTALAAGLGSSFEPLVSQFVPTLLTLCGRTNKVFTSRARTCILAIIQHTHLPSLLSYLAELANHKSVFPRLIAAEGILACLNCFNPPDLEKEARARTVEDFIKSTARDASADVRKASKDIFKAYKTLLPARVESFVAPLTPVVKKYLDIQAGPSGVHGASINAGKMQPSRPASRANSRMAETGHRPASATLPKPCTRPVTDDLVHNTRQRPATHALPTAVDVRVPQQRTVSQLQRDPPSRNLLINTQSSSSAAQRWVVPTSAPARQAAQLPAPSVTRVLPVWNAPSRGGPQRPPPTQMKFNPPPDRLKVTGNGAKRVPLPPLPVDGQSSGQGNTLVNSADRPSSVADDPRKLPSRHTEAVAPGKSACSRKATEGPRPASSSIKSASGSAPVALVVAQRSKKQPVMDRDKMTNANTTVPQRRPAGNVQKATRPLVKAEQKETSPTLVPLPPSPSIPPAEIPLPPSPDCTPLATDAEAYDEPAVVNLREPIDPAGKQLRPMDQEQGNMVPPSTPITALLSSIQRGFLFTPCSPLSPPQNYLPASDDLPGKRQMRMGDFTKGSRFCTPLEGDSVVDGLDRHALRDLN